MEKEEKSKKASYKIFGYSLLGAIALISEQAIFPKFKTNKKNLRTIIEKQTIDQKSSKFTNGLDDLKQYNLGDTIEIYDNYKLKEINGMPILIRYFPQNQITTK